MVGEKAEAGLKGRPQTGGESSWRDSRIFDPALIFESRVFGKDQVELRFQLEDSGLVHRSVI